MMVLGVTKKVVFIFDENGHVYLFRSIPEAISFLKRSQAIGLGNTLTVWHSSECSEAANQILGDLAILGTFREIRKLPKFAAVLVRSIVHQHDFEGNLPFAVVEAIDDELWIHRVDLPSYQVESTLIPGLGPVHEKQYVNMLLRNELNRIMSGRIELKHREEELILQAADSILPELRNGRSDFSIHLTERSGETTAELYKSYKRYFDERLRMVYPHLNTFGRVFRYVFVGEMFHGLDIHESVLAELGIERPTLLLLPTPAAAEMIASNLEYNIEPTNLIAKYSTDETSSNSELAEFTLAEGEVEMGFSQGLKQIFQVHVDPDDKNRGVIWFNDGTGTLRKVSVRIKPNFLIGISAGRNSASIEGVLEGSQIEVTDGDGNRECLCPDEHSGFYSCLSQDGSEFHLRLCLDSSSNERLNEIFIKEMEIFEEHGGGIFPKVEAIDKEKRYRVLGDWIHLPEYLELMKKSGFNRHLSRNLFLSMMRIVACYYQKKISPASQENLEDILNRKGLSFQPLSFLRLESFLVAKNTNPRSIPQMVLWTMGLPDELDEHISLVHYRFNKYGERYWNSRFEIGMPTRLARDDIDSLFRIRKGILEGLDLENDTMVIACIDRFMKLMDEIKTMLPDDQQLSTMEKLIAACRLGTCGANLKLGSIN
jgi:hypothetical protein